MLLSCHILARAFARHFPQLICLDGHYTKIVNHSWLYWKDPKRGRGWIIDVYPVATYPAPLLVDCALPTAFIRLYVHGSEARGLAELCQTESFQRAVDRLAAEIERLLLQTSTP